MLYLSKKSSVSERYPSLKFLVKLDDSDYCSGKRFRPNDLTATRVCKAQDPNENVSPFDTSTDITLWDDYKYNIKTLDLQGFDCKALSDLTIESDNYYPADQQYFYV